MSAEEVAILSPEGQGKKVKLAVFVDTFLGLGLWVQERGGLCLRDVHFPSSLNPSPAFLHHLYGLSLFPSSSSSGACKYFAQESENIF